MDKIEFKNLPDQSTAISANNLNQMQSNIEKSVVVVSATKPTTNEKVWIQKGKNLLDLKKLTTKTQNGLTWTPDLENDCINITGTATGYSAMPLFANFVPEDDIIISLNGKMADATNVTTQVNLYKDGVATDLGSIYSLDISEYDFDYCTISLKRKTNVATSTNVKVQIEYGSNVTSYETYVPRKILTKNDNGIYEEFVPDSSNKHAITANLSANQTSTATSTFIKFNASNFVGYKLKLRSDGSVLIGAGINKVKISAQLYIEGTIPSNPYLYIRKNYSTDLVYNIGAYNIRNVYVMPVIVDVQEGDTLQVLLGMANATAEYSIKSGLSYFTVEAI